jgi:hypothetical protein
LSVTCGECLAGWWRTDADLIQTIVGKDILPPLPL